MSPTTPLSRAPLDASGGFNWWYLDALDQNGDGLVLIWSFGLPFMPGYRASRGCAAEWPALNIAVYKDGEEDFYLLQRISPSDARWTGSFGSERFEFGDTVIERRVARGEVHLEVELNAPLPRGERVRGHISARGALREAATEPEVVDDDVHQWSPLSTRARVRAQLRSERWQSAIDTNGYLDRNGCARPLWDLGITHWRWGRANFAREDIVYYLADSPRGPIGGGLVISPEGHTRRVALDVEVSARERAWTGASLASMTLRERDSGAHFLDNTLVSFVDHGPFYGRGLYRASRREESVLGVGEEVWPTRVDRPWQLPFIRQRAFDATEPPALAPLFSGPQRGRWRRLLRAA